MTDTSSAPRGRSGWFRAGIIASLALNLLFIGGLGAAAWRHRHGPRGDDMGLAGFARRLPAERQTLVRGDVDAAKQVIRPLRKAVREAWTESNALLTAEPFDKGKFKAALDKLTEAETRFKSAATAALVDTAAKLTAEERRSLQGWREKRRPRMFGRHGHRNGRDDDGDNKGDGPGAGPSDGSRE
jgi:uncharacterized membrane protein